MGHEKPRRLRKCRVSPNRLPNQTNILYFLLPTSAFSGRTQNVVRLVVNVNYIASNKLSDLARLGLILHMEFT